MASKAKRSIDSVIKYEDDFEYSDFIDKPLDELEAHEDLKKTGEDSNIHHDSDDVVCTIIKDKGDINLISDKDNKEVSTIICKFCSNTFESSSHLRKHQCNISMIIPTKSSQLPSVNNTNYSCNLCKKIFKYEVTYSHHMLNEHSSLPQSISCNLCKARCPNKEILKLHVSKMHNNQIFKCPFCKVVFSRGYSLNRHLEEMGCNGLSGVKTFSCEICGAPFLEKNNLVKHIQNNHKASTLKFHCKCCKFKAQNFNTLVIHFKKFHMENGFICDICDVRLDSRLAVTKHLRTHKEKKYSCGACKYTCNNIKLMKSHEISHKKSEAKKNFKCSECNSSFMLRNQLRAHYELMHGHTCEICDMVVNSRLRFIIHIRSHMVLDELVCPMSSCRHKKFVNNKTLNKHLETHDKQKQTFKCDSCTKVYSKVIDLRRHSLVHALKRSRRCIYCMSALAFGHGDRLLRHLRLDHPDVFAQHLDSIKRVPTDIYPPDYHLSREETCEILAIIDSLEEQMVQQHGSNLFAGIGLPTGEVVAPEIQIKTQPSPTPVMGEVEFGDCVLALLTRLLEEPTLKKISGGVLEPDTTLQRVIQHCDAKPILGNEMSCGQRMRENLKLLLVHVLEDDDVRKMLETHSLDQVLIQMLTVHWTKNDH